jgi:hypothetical protein
MCMFAHYAKLELHAEIIVTKNYIFNPPSICRVVTKMTLTIFAIFRVRQVSYYNSVAHSCEFNENFDMPSILHFYEHRE